MNPALPRGHSQAANLPAMPLTLYIGRPNSYELPACAEGRFLVLRDIQLEPRKWPVIQGGQYS